MRTTGIIVAAGLGERFSAAEPKAYATLAGEPMFVHAVRALARAKSVDDLVVVVPPAAKERTARLLDEAGWPSVTLCPGGATRQLSVAAGLAACLQVEGIVAVHDAARPLVSPALVDRTIAALTQPWSAVAPALPVVDTLKLVDPARDRVLGTVDRRALWAVQTPQVFSWNLLQQLHGRTHSTVTDDLELVEAAGGLVRIVPGERRNFKITYPEDLAMAEALVASGRP